MNFGQIWPKSDKPLEAKFAESYFTKTKTNTYTILYKIPTFEQIGNCMKSYVPFTHVKITPNELGYTTTGKNSLGPNLSFFCIA